MNQEEADGEKGGRGVNQNRDVSQETKIPGNDRWEPENGSAEEQSHGTPEKSPEEKFLAGIVASGRRHLVVLIGAVVADGFPPRSIGIGVLHLGRPHGVHIPDGGEENEAGPGMEHS